MDVFLGGQFTKYGTDVISVSELPIEQRVDPMNKVFPKVTKCTFHKVSHMTIMIDILLLTNGYIVWSLVEALEQQRYNKGAY